MANDTGKTVKTGAAAGLIGMVIGAAAGAAAVALSDKKNRQKVQRATDRLQKEGKSKIEELKKMAQRYLNEAEHEVEKGQKQVEKRLPKPAQS